MSAIAVRSATGEISTSDEHVARYTRPFGQLIRRGDNGGGLDTWPKEPTFRHIWRYPDGYGRLIECIIGPEVQIFRVYNV